MPLQHAEAVPEPVVPRRGVVVPRWGIEASLVAVALLSTLAGVAYARYGSIGGAVAAACGQGLTVDAHTKSFGVANANSAITIPFTLKNLTDKPIRIIGANTTCTCTFPDIKLPLDIRPWGSRQIRISVTLPSSTPTFRQGVRFYTDLPSQPAVVLEITGDVRPRDPARRAH